MCRSAKSLTQRLPSTFTREEKFRVTSAVAQGKSRQVHGRRYRGATVQRARTLSDQDVDVTTNNTHPRELLAPRDYERQAPRHQHTRVLRYARRWLKPGEVRCINMRERGRCQEVQWKVVADPSATAKCTAKSALCGDDMKLHNASVTSTMLPIEATTRETKA